MAGKLLDELKQKAPFSTLDEEAALNILRTGDLLNQTVADLLKPYNISPTQYNILRILRGAGSIGISCKEVAARLVTKDPDITRLMDRLESRGLLKRDRAKEDRRFVTITITPDGLALTNELDGPIKGLRRCFKGISKERLASLIESLEQVRASIAS